MNRSLTREVLSKLLLEKTQAILASRALDRETLALIEKEVTKLSDQTELWGEEDFRSPSQEEKQNRYLIAQDGKEGLSLYLNVMQPGKKIQPHNHTTWGCVGAVEGVEINTLYDRVDDGSAEGKAELKQTAVVNLKPGNAISMLADDIHSVEIGGTEIIRHLHFYGQSLESLKGRYIYDLDEGTFSVMGIGVKTK
jgi:predicted metal-dependent enzyme (double-stranded beta helix superfamily)